MILSKDFVISIYPLYYLAEHFNMLQLPEMIKISFPRITTLSPLDDIRSIEMYKVATVQCLKEHDTKLLDSLCQRQLKNGSWQCFIDITALVVMALQLMGDDENAANLGLNFIINSKNEDGGFREFCDLEISETAQIGFQITHTQDQKNPELEMMSSAARWILAKMKNNGSWSFTDSFPVGDLDDTSVIGYWLKSSKLLNGDNIDKISSLLLSNQMDNGGFPAWKYSQASVDVTAHVCMFLNEIAVNSPIGTDDAFKFLIRNQLSDGSWAPTWNISKIYGTSQVLWSMKKEHVSENCFRRGLNFILQEQREDGSWGSPEETGLGIQTLLDLENPQGYEEHIKKGLTSLISPQNISKNWQGEALWRAKSCHTSQAYVMASITSALLMALKR